VVFAIHGLRFLFGDRRLETRGFLDTVTATGTRFVDGFATRDKDRDPL